MTPKVVVLDYGSGNLRSAERALARAGADLKAAPRTEGCGVFPGTIDHLNAPVLPHMGWNTVAPPDGSVLFRGIPDDTRFYFVHSFAMRMRDADPLQAAGAKLTVTEHGEPFAAAVEQGVVAATQFHPEKSGDAGAAVLK